MSKWGLFIAWLVLLESYAHGQAAQDLLADPLTYYTVNYTRSWPDKMASRFFEKMNHPCSQGTEQGVRSLKFSTDLATFSKCNHLIATLLFGQEDLLKRAPASDAKGCFIAFLDRPALQMHLAIYGAQNRTSLSRLLRWNMVMVEFPYDSTSSREASRILKLDLPRFFPWIEWSLWIDAKHRLLVPLSQVVRVFYQFAPRMHMGFMHHPLRVAVSDEIQRVVRNKWMSPLTAARQLAAYSAAGINVSQPTGLLEGGLILRNHQVLATHMVSCFWGEQYRRFPPRDQTSIPYVLFSLGYVLDTPMEILDQVRRGQLPIEQLRLTYVNEVLGSDVAALPPVLFKEFTEETIHLRYRKMQERAAYTRLLLRWKMKRIPPSVYMV